MFGTINVIGGFLVTDRMLGMFKRKPDPVESAGADSTDSATPSAPGKADSPGAESGGAGSQGDAK
jgi:NAD/NADP transhydrogenase alpha subunit